MHISDIMSSKVKILLPALKYTTGLLYFLNKVEVFFFCRIYTLRIDLLEFELTLNKQI